MTQIEKIKLLNYARDESNIAHDPKTPSLTKIKALNAARDALIKVGLEIKKAHPTTETPVFDAIERGDYDDLDVDLYVEKVRQAYDEINVLEKLFAPAERYIEKHQNSVDAVGESLLNIEELETIGEGYGPGGHKADGTGPHGRGNGPGGGKADGSGMDTEEEDEEEEEEEEEDEETEI